MPRQIQSAPAEVPESKSVPAKPGKNLRVLHTQVGSWPKGFVFSTDDLPEGADVARLISIGAVEHVSEPRTGDAPLGPDTINPPKAEPVKPEPSVSAEVVAVEKADEAKV